MVIKRFRFIGAGILGLSAGGVAYVCGEERALKVYEYKRTHHAFPPSFERNELERYLVRIAELEMGNFYALMNGLLALSVGSGMMLANFWGVAILKNMQPGLL